MVFTFEALNYSSLVLANGLRRYHIPLAAGTLLLAACQGATRDPTVSVPDTVRLLAGKYDVPYFVEPRRDIVLVAREVSFDRLGGEASRSPGIGQSDLQALKAAPEPLQLRAYKFRPSLASGLDLQSDAGEIAAAEAAGPIQICVVGSGCVDFYVRAEVLALEFRSRRDASAYEAKLAAYLNRFSPEPSLSRRGVYINPSVAVLRRGRSLFVVSSWTPSTIEAILAQLS